jgi:hypothetical protein
MRLPSLAVGSVVAGLFRMRKLNVLVTALCFAMLANWPAVAQSPAVVRNIFPYGNMLGHPAYLITSIVIAAVISRPQVS